MKKNLSGLVYNCHTNDLTVGNQNLVRTHIYEKEQNDICIV